tara:strand:- start:403 stop:669 length:267 start_codon:yes stop_codon:yes gene_type:complete
MKFELKTEKENHLQTLSKFLIAFFGLTLIIIFCDIALKLGIISRHYQIQYKCVHLSVEKSKPNFKKLSNLSNLKSKQKIWEYCNEVLK